MCVIKFSLSRIHSKFASHYIKRRYSTVSFWLRVCIFVGQFHYAIQYKIENVQLQKTILCVCEIVHWSRNKKSISILNISPIKKHYLRNDSVIIWKTQICFVCISLDFCTRAKQKKIHNYDGCTLELCKWKFIDFPFFAYTFFLPFFLFLYFFSCSHAYFNSASNFHGILCGVCFFVHWFIVCLRFQREYLMKLLEYTVQCFEFREWNLTNIVKFYTFEHFCCIFREIASLMNLFWARNFKALNFLIAESFRILN